MSATLLHTQLLKQVRQLARKEPKRPRQGSVRRAVSAAYYALFHFLTYQASRQIVGSHHDRASERSVVRRAYVHAEMKQACQSWSGGNLPAYLQRSLGALTIPDELRKVARAFVDLQGRRHEADYDHAASITRQDALDAVDLAQRAMVTHFPAVRTDDATRVFLSTLNGWWRLKGR